MELREFLSNRPPGGWSLLIPVVFAALTTVVLCIWQISRGFEMQELRNSYVERLKLPPISAAEYVENQSDYLKIRLEGTFDADRAFIVAHQRHNSRPGFWIVQRFNTYQGSFLVNRGFVPVAGTWYADPEFDTPRNVVEISGVVWPQLPSTTDDSYEEPGWPKRVKRVNVDQMVLASGSYSDEIRLLADSPGVLTPIHLLMQHSAARHWGYAIQWLIIGALVVGGYWFLAVRKPDSDS